ncbi:MAG: TonB-dependent receptor [Pseudomonadota bacterium]
MKVFALLSCCSMLSLAAVDASAQDAPVIAQSDPSQPAPDQVDEPAEDTAIVVTGSRVVTNGYQAPTPITVISAEELKDGSPNITEALRQLPQLTGSSSPASIGNTPNGSVASTSDTANLRNLGITRTLVLLDGRRAPASGITGTSDIGLFPLALVKSVDIVTGGASAAYGSDAVAGVVNFTLDTKFRGISAEVRNGISARGDGRSYGLQLSGGTGFAGGRGSFIFSANISGQEGVSGYARDWSTRYWATIPNVLANQPGQPQTLLRENVNMSSLSFGGLITSPGPLQDIQFDYNGNPIPYRHGTNNTGNVEVGGDGAKYPNVLTADYSNRSVFGHVDFEVADGFKVFAEGAYGYTRAEYPNLYKFYANATALTIQRDNAYLPASIRQTMINSGITSFRLGKMLRNFGANEITNANKTVNAIIGFNAEVGGVSIDGYYEHGESRFNMISDNQQILANFNRAVDAVVGPSGQIVCRSTLTNPTNGCVPWSPFGELPYTDAQRAYQGASGYTKTVAKQDVIALNFRATPFTNWAGDVAVAVGAEYRSQSAVTTVDPIAAVAGFAQLNPQPSGGRYNVKEAFGELLFPLFRGSTFLKSLDFNGAFRYTDYSTSGGVQTWKLGLTGEVVSGLRLRGTYSQDVRAPNIGDLYGPRTNSVTAITDPFRGRVTTSNVAVRNGSNPALVPESARTLTMGAIFQPKFLPGFGASIDYYRIEIEDAISTLSFQRIVDQCFAGDAYLCSQITRDAGNVITEINGSSLNIQVVKISGTDFEASYRFNLGSGTLQLRGVATHLDDLSAFAPGAAPIQQAGTDSSPKFRGNLNLTYSIGGTTIAVQERIVGSHRRAVPPSTIDNDHVGAVAYTSLTVRHKFEGKGFTPELFLTVNNLFDRDPPVSGTQSGAVGIARAADPTLYDVLGRYVTVGARARF